MPQCPHCQNTTFQLQEAAITGANFTYAIVYCANCGAPAGVLEKGNVNEALAQQEAAIDEIADQICLF